MDRRKVVSMFLALGTLILASGDLSAQAAGGASAMAEAEQCDLGCSTVTYPGEEGTWGYACRIGAGGGYDCGASANGCVTMICTSRYCCRNAAYLGPEADLLSAGPLCELAGLTAAESRGEPSGSAFSAASSIVGTS